MRYTMERLVSGDTSVIIDYQIAVERWKVIWNDPQAQQANTLANLLADEQRWFDHNCGGCWEGQEVMVLAGFGSLYTTEGGFGKNRLKATRLKEAFEQSRCAAGMRGIAAVAAKAYDL